MQNYYIRIEDMPSLESHQLSIIKYVVLKKIFFLSVLTVSFGLDSDSNLFGLGLVLDSTKVDLTTALLYCLFASVHILNTRVRVRVFGED